MLKYPSKKADTEYVILDTVTKIDKYAFYQNLLLQKVTIPEGVTIIDECSFGGCYALTDVVFLGKVTTIERAAFYQCDLRNFTIPATVNSIGDSAFSFSSMENITISNGVTSIGDMAFAYSFISSITIPASVTHIGDSAFAYNSPITDMNIVVDEENQAYCVENGVLFDKEKTRLIVFGKWTSVSTYVIPDTVIYIDEAAFYGGLNSILTEITIPASVENIGKDAFSYCNSLKKIDVDSENEYYSSLNGVLFDKNQTTLIRCPECEDSTYEIPEGVISIADNAFQFNNLIGITIPESVTSIGENAFSNCEQFTTIYGKAGSYAQTYAEAYEYTFIPSS